MLRKLAAVIVAVERDQAILRAEKAERELDLRKRLMHGLPICGGCMAKHRECQACRADKLQADLDAALDALDYYLYNRFHGEESISASKALLEKRREGRG